VLETVVDVADSPSERRHVCTVLVRFRKLPILPKLLRNAKARMTCSGDLNTRGRKGRHPVEQIQLLNPSLFAAAVQALPVHGTE
jgi:hypothetical protein